VQSLNMHACLTTTRPNSSSTWIEEDLFFLIR
jgi:hypothetical protein